MSHRNNRAPAPQRVSAAQDIKFPNPPSDGISSVSINGYNNQPSNLAIATSWDNSVSCYEIKIQNGCTIIPQGQIKHDSPVLCSDISSRDNVTVFSGGCDGYIKMWNVTQGPTAVQMIAKHDGPVNNVKFLDNGMLLSSSWDKKVCFWDLRQHNPTHTLPIGKKVFSMDARGQAAVILTADTMSTPDVRQQEVQIYDLSAGRLIGSYDAIKKGTEANKKQTKYPYQCVSVFADQKGFALGNIEGRIAIEYFNELEPKPGKLRQFSFKCHRMGMNSTDVYAVNAIHFSKHNTFVSVGSDGGIDFWDKDAKLKLGSHDAMKGKCPINDVKFNPDATMMVYGASYDWSKGAENNDQNKYGVNLYLHAVQDNEVKPRPKKFM